MEKGCSSNIPQAPFISFSAGDWYAIRVRSKCERCVAAGLEAKNYKHFLPVSQEVRQWANRIRRVERILIPGYVFAQFDFYKRLPVLTIPGVTDIVGTRYGPSAIPASELNALRIIVESGSAAAPWVHPVIGQQVEIRSGPLRGLRGCLVEVKNQARVVVSITLLSRSVAAEVELSYVHSVMPVIQPESVTPLEFVLRGIV